MIEVCRTYRCCADFREQQKGEVMNLESVQAQLAAVEKNIANLEGMCNILSPEAIQEALTPLLEKKVELEAQISSGSYSATATGGSVIAQGPGATAVASRGVSVGGSVGGSIITGDNSQVSGIQAHTIGAENVVSGVQQLGGRGADSANWVELAKALGTGSIKADSIEAKNVVSGLQFIADPNQATPEQLRQELAMLKAQLATAITAGEIEDAGDVEDVQGELSIAEAELRKLAPNGNRVVRKLKTVTDILTESATAAQAAKKTGVAIIKLAPVAAVLYQIATNLFAN